MSIVLRSTGITTHARNSYLPGTQPTVTTPTNCLLNAVGRGIRHSPPHAPGQRIRPRARSRAVVSSLRGGRGSYSRQSSLTAWRRRKSNSLGPVELARAAGTASADRGQSDDDSDSSSLVAGHRSCPPRGRRRAAFGHSCIVFFEPPRRELFIDAAEVRL